MQSNLLSCSSQASIGHHILAMVKFVCILGKPDGWSEQPKSVDEVDGRGEGGGARVFR